MTPSPQDYPWHPQPPRWRYGMFVFLELIAGAAWLGFRAEPSWWPRAIIGSIAFVAVGLVVEQQTRIDVTARTIVQEGRLLGRLRVWSFRHSLDEFTDVVLRRQRDPDGNDSVLVELRRHSGRNLAVRYFNAGQGKGCPEAEQAARSLAESTGLRLRDEPH